MKVRHIAAAVSVAALLTGCSSGSGAPVTVTVLTGTDSSSAISSPETVSSERSPSPTSAEQISSLTAANPVSFASSAPGASFNYYSSLIPISSQYYGAMVSSDREGKQNYLLEVDSATGEVKWKTDDLGPSIDAQTGLGRACVTLDETTMSCSSGSLIDLETGEVTKNSWTAAVATDFGYVTGDRVDGDWAISSFSKTRTAPQWQVIGYRLIGLTPNGNLLAYRYERGGAVKDSAELSAETGKVISQITGQGAMDAEGWLRSVPGSGDDTPGITERVNLDGTTGWTQPGIPAIGVRGDASWVTGGSNPSENRWIDTETPAPVVTQSGHGYSWSADVEAFRGVDAQTGSSLWTCTEEQCGADQQWATINHLIGSTPDRIIVSANTNMNRIALMNRTTGEILARWTSSQDPVYTGVLTPTYAMYPTQSADGAEILSAVSLNTGAEIWSASTSDISQVVQTGDCFVITSRAKEGQTIKDVTQTRVCPS